MTIVVAICLVLVGLSIMRRLSMWGGLTIMILGIVTVLAATPGLMNAATTLTSALTSGVNAFISGLGG